MTAVLGTLRAAAYAEDTCRSDVAATQAIHAQTIQDFSRVYYHARHTWGTTRYQGVPILKAPTDLWTYQEWIHHLTPDVLIETGTAFGGSAAYFADLMAPHRGHVFSVDTEVQPDRPVRPNLAYVQGSSTDPAVVALLIARIEGRRTMVVLDSNHHADHVRAELDVYAPMVSRGQLLVVEDTNLSDPALSCEPVPGPAHAIAGWLPNHPEFARERLCERYLLTFHPGGWLRRVA